MQYVPMREERGILYRDCPATDGRDACIDAASCLGCVVCEGFAKTQGDTPRYSSPYLVGASGFVACYLDKPEPLPVCKLCEGEPLVLRDPSEVMGNVPAGSVRCTMHTLWMHPDDWRKLMGGREC